jgi:hypothetical protein
MQGAGGAQGSGALSNDTLRHTLPGDLLTLRRDRGHFAVSHHEYFLNFPPILTGKLDEIPRFQ